MRATSRRRTCEPSGFTLSRMLPNSCGVRSSVASVMVAFRRCVCGAGVPPSWPPGDLHVLALHRGGHVERRQREAFSLFGSSQMRIAYCVPKTLMLPTPLIRLIGSWMLETT